MNNNYIDYTTQTNINYDIVKSNNEYVINELRHFYKNEQSITIIGKGETATYIPNALGVNQAIIFTNCRFLFLNDFESIFGVEHLLSKVEYIFCPDYPHCNQHASLNNTFLKIFKYTQQYGFNGKMFIYKIATSKSNALQQYELQTSTTTHIIIDFFNRFLNIRHFIFYGISMGTSYHNDIINLNFSLSRQHPLFHHYYESIKSHDKIKLLKSKDGSHNLFRSSMDKKINIGLITTIIYN